MSPFLDRVIEGALSPVEGLRALLSDRKTLLFALVPFLVGLFLIFVLLVGTFSWVTPWVNGLAQSFPAWSESFYIKQSAAFVIMLFAFIAVTITNVLLGYLVVLLFAGPFYSIMVEHRFKLAGVLKEDRGNIGLVIKMFGLALVKVMVFAVIGIICFLMAFVPILNIAAAFIVFLLIAFDCSDFAFEMDFLSLRDRFRFIFNHLPEYVGLSAAISLTSLVPGSFFILLPAFICGATKIYIQRRQPSV